jgi:acyl-CoA synthetase (AMP-forming)/AMP-acid ligase II
MSIPPLFTLRDLARPSPAAAIVVCNGQRQAQVTTYSDLVSQAIGAAADFLADVPKLTVVAMCMGNTKEFVATYLGITAYANCVALPLNPTTSRAEAQSTLQDSGAKVLFADDAGSASCVVAGELGLRVVVVAASTFSARRANAAVYVDRPPHPADTALLLFTSGTTAKPKLVPLSHHNLVTSIANIRNTYQLDERDSSYLVMPLFHIHGLQSALCATLASGGTVLLPAAGKFSANVFWRDVVEHKATWCAVAATRPHTRTRARHAGTDGAAPRRYTAVPTIHQILLARADTDRALIAQARLRFIRSCSASLAPATLEKLEQVTKAVVLEAYAMSEAAHQMTSNPLPVNGPRKPGSVGRGGWLLASSSHLGFRAQAPTSKSPSATRPWTTWAPRAPSGRCAWMCVWQG